MKFSVGSNIRRNRLERNLTQEEVAVHLGVSFQTISKWERGDRYPDIEMLPVISNYFGISVDELLGISESERKNKYDEINNLWLVNNKNGLHDENVELMKSALKSFPNDALLLVQLSTSLEKLDGTDEEKHKNILESIALQEQIIRFCDDSEVRGATLYNICFAYWKSGDRNKAIEQAKKLPNLYKSRENALVYFLDGDEKRKIAKEALKPLAWAVAHHMKALAETEPDCRKKALQIINILFSEEDKDDFIRKMCNDLADG